MENKDKELNIADLQQRLKECEEKTKEYLSGWQRSRADFLNYKKEEMERIGELIKYASEELILKILPILDNFYLVEKNLPENLRNEENIKGILQIKNQIQDFLKSQGVEELNFLGQKFDPNFMEVIEEVEPASAEASAGKSGIVVEEIQKGYKINGRLLRPAKVRVVK